MAHHRQSFAIGEMSMPLMETPEQQRIMNLEEQLKQEKESHKETKSQLEIAEIKRASEVEGLKSAIQCLVLHNQTSTKNNLESENDSKIQKLESELEKLNKKFDESKEQISKGQMQEELEKLKETNKKLESKNVRLQEELSESTTTTKGLEEKIEKIEKTYAELKSRNAEELEKLDIKKHTKIQELEETIRQKECRLDEFEKMNSKYEEAIVKSNDMDKLQKAMKDIELKHSQLQQQQQQQQQQLNSDSSYSKKLKECLSLQKKTLDAFYNKEFDLYGKLNWEYTRCADGLSVDDKKKCHERWDKYCDDHRKKQMDSISQLYR